MSWRQFKTSAGSIPWGTYTDYASWWHFSQNEVTNSHRADSDLSQAHNMLVSSAFDAIPAVLSLESTDPSSDVKGFLAIDVCSVRKWRKVKTLYCLWKPKPCCSAVWREARSVLSLATYITFPQQKFSMDTDTLNNMSSSVMEASAGWGHSDETHKMWEQRSSRAGSKVSWWIMCFSVESSSWITPTLAANCLSRCTGEAQQSSPLLNFSPRESLTKLFCKPLSQEEKEKFL